MEVSVQRWQKCPQSSLKNENSLIYENVKQKCKYQSNFSQKTPKGSTYVCLGTELTIYLSSATNEDKILSIKLKIAFSLVLQMMEEIVGRISLLR